MRTILKPFDKIESNLSYLHFLNYCQDTLNDPRSVELKRSSKELLKEIISYGSYQQLDIAIRFEEALNSNVDLKILDSLGLIKPYSHRFHPDDYKATRLGYVFYTHHSTMPLALKCRMLSVCIGFITIGISAILTILGVSIESFSFVSDGFIAIFLSLLSLVSIFLCNEWFDHWSRSTTKEQYIQLLFSYIKSNKTSLVDIVNNLVLVNRLIRVIDRNAFL